jgi:hypothetical protein
MVAVVPDISRRQIRWHPALHPALFGEGRWTRAEDELEGDFENFGDIDLSGREFVAGISWNL